MTKTFLEWSVADRTAKWNELVSNVITDRLPIPKIQRPELITGFLSREDVEYFRNKLNNKQMTLGEDRIGSFNPSGEGVIDGIKKRIVELIDYIDENVTSELNPEKAGDIARLKAIAVTSLEKASMDSVKAYIHYKK